MGLPIRSAGLDMHINRALINDKVTAETGLAWCHKTGSVPHLPVTLWEADSGQVFTCVCLKPDRAAAQQAGAYSGSERKQWLVVPGRDFPMWLVLH